MEAIRSVGLSRTYGEIEALKPLDLAVPAGSVFGFLGRNGAGKTTTIRLMTGLAKPTSGSAWVDGVKTTDGDERGRSNFGYLPEEPAFYTWMKPTEFLDYIGQLFGLGPAERKRRIAELLELADLKDAAGRRIGGFSRGMRQRLGLAQALIHRPPVLFLDEPTSALDPAGRHDVLQLIDQLRGQTTVFLSSHILGDVERVCDTIGVIHEGQLLLVAERDELLNRYAANVVLMEFELDGRPVPASFLSDLKSQPWINGVTEEVGRVRVAVGNVVAGKERLLPMVLEHGLILARYEWVRPTLEEVFLSISA